jgi:hypothetical protein
MLWFSNINQSLTCFVVAVVLMAGSLKAQNTPVPGQYLAPPSF